MSIIWIDSGRFAVAAASLLLDTYTGAAAAYSLRQLRTGVTNVVRVRRSSDNMESDFTATQVADGTLTSWVGAGGNGFVSTWYDQSGNGRNVTQTTTANQPQIVSSGSLVLQNSRPTLDFDGSNDRLINSALSLSQPETVFAVARRDVVGFIAPDIIVDSYNSVRHAFYNQGNQESPNFRWVATAGTNNANELSIIASELDNTNLNLFSVLFNGNSSSIFINGSQYANGALGADGLSGLSIGDIRGNPSPIVSGYAMDGKISELIIYASNQSSNRSAIESNINANYSMY
jgi:hypothetical protein